MKKYPEKDKKNDLVSAPTPRIKLESKKAEAFITFTLELYNRKQ